jgi:type I restriction enzyme S subunit
MKAKTKTTATKEEATPALVPKLRFPEFRGKKVRSVQLGDVTEEGRSRNGSKHAVASVMGVTKADGIVPMEARLIAADIARYKLVEKNWFAYNPMRLNIGSIARWTGDSEILVSPDYVVFKCITDDESGIAPGYLDQFRQTKAWEGFVTEGGDGSVRVRIYFKDIARLGLALPSPAEQQKIAECLSSVDELMAAQARKVDALKTHKKGLMQQLFPREGETQPRLRFPEFQNAGEWVESPLSEFILSLDAGVSVNSGDSRPADKTELGVLKTSAITKGQFDPEENKVVLAKDELSRLSEPVTGGTIIMCRKNTPALVGSNAYVESSHENLFLPDLLWAAKPREGVSMRFLAFILGSDKGRAALSKLATGSSASMSNITKPEVLAFSVMAPSPAEQQRIATCLSSLDALITAETQKHEALKTHKKGLMQQLFPAPTEQTHTSEGQRPGLFPSPEEVAG